MDLELRPIGTVESPLTDPAKAPKQGDEGAPDAWLVLEPSMLEALEGLAPGDDVLVLTWLHRVRIVGLDGARVKVSDLEAVNGTPVVDLKPVLSADPSER